MLHDRHSGMQGRVSFTYLSPDRLSFSVDSSQVACLYVKIMLCDTW